MRLLIAEKPSVARDLARVLGASTKNRGFFEGNGLRVSWCFGHMCELQEPAHYNPAWKSWSLASLPMLPETFALKVRKGAKEQFDLLQKLMRARDVEQVVNCCDAGREGELIFRYVYEQAGCTKPVMRLWVSSLTDSAITDAWKRLRPGSDFDPLADAARSRSEADWLVGLNATRALTCRSREGGGGALLSLGRVQTPTLAMIVARDLEIEAFVSEPFWRVAATFKADLDTDPNTWTAFWFRPEVPEAAKGEDDDEEDAPHAERLGTEDAAAMVVAAAKGGVGRVEKASRKRTKERPPLLYDLTALQRRANQRYALSAQRTLEVAQALYEKHKLLTYPRTDARFLTPDQVPGLADVVRGLQPIPTYAPHCQRILAQPIKPGKRVVNAAEVGDHHAILPTGRTPSGGLSPDEKRIFDLVARRLLAVLSDDALFDVTELITAVDPQGPLPDDVAAPLRFRARGKVCRQEGWRAVDPPGKSAQVELPAVEVGDEAPAVEVDAREGKTRPPRPYSDASLLRAMETAGRQLNDEELERAMRSRGLGTPATRAAILQTLLDRAYLVRDKRALTATEKGRALIAAVTVDALKSPELTGKWEGRLTDMAEGTFQRVDFMRAVAGQTQEIVDAIRAAPAPDVVADPRPASEGKALGNCPVCGTPVHRRGTVWSCETGRDCPFVVFEKMAKRTISDRMVRQLLTTGKSEPVQGFKSRAGKDFAAGLTWDPEQKRVSFWFEDRPRSPEGQRCPTCGQGTVIKGRTSYGCSRWREGCGYRTEG